MQRNHFEHIITSYGLLAQKVDDWFQRCCSNQPEAIACKRGCSDCCRGLFDITILDAALLSKGVVGLGPAVREPLAFKARSRLEALKLVLPEFSFPWLLNRFSEEYVTNQLIDDDAPCIFLNDAGECIVYDFRPLTCRLHGIPAYDMHDDCYSDEHCSLNFIGVKLPHPQLARADFPGIFREEQKLLTLLTNELFGFPVGRCDTLIPAAVCVDYQEMTLVNSDVD